MKKFAHLILACALCLVLGACDEDSEPTAPGTGTQPAPAPQPVKPVNCTKFQDFYVVYTSMREQANLLIEQKSQTDRLVTASAIFAQHLMRSYSAAASMRTYNAEVQQTYLKYFSWIFNADGLVLETPGHPQTKICLKKG